MDIAELGFEIDSSTAVKATGDLNKMNDAAGRAETGIEKMARKIQRDMERINEQIRAATGFVKGFVGALASIQTVRSLTGMADSWSDLTSRVRLSIGAHDDAVKVMDRLYKVARQTYSSFELTAETFTRNATTLNALGVSTARQLDYLQALNNGLVISGAKADRAAMVQNSLAKALAEGALRGEELNNTLAYGGRIAELLADELGVNVTELRKVGAQGRITSEILFNSLVKNMQLLTDQAETMPATIGDAFTLLRNSVLRTLGVFDQQNKLSESFAEKLITVADNMDDVISAAVTLGKVLLTIYGTKMLMSAAAYTAELVRQGVQYVRNTNLATMWAAANAQGLAASIKSIGILNAAIGGLGAALTGWQIGTYLREQFLEVERFGIAMVGGLLKAWERLKAYGIAAWEGIKAAALGAVNVIRTAAANIMGALATANEATDPFGIKSGITDRLREVEQQLRPTTSAWDGFKEAVGSALVSMSANEQSIDATMMDLWEYAAAQREVADGAGQSASANDALAGSFSDLGTAIAGYSKAQEEADLLAEENAKAQAAFNIELERWAASLLPQAERAAEEYNIAVRALYADQKAGKLTTDQLARALGLLGKEYQQNAREAAKNADVLGRIRKQYEEQAAAIGMTDREFSVYQAGLEAARDAQATFGDELANMPGYLDDAKKEAEDAADSLFTLGKAFQIIENAKSPFQRMIEDVGDLREALERMPKPGEIGFDEKAFNSTTEAIRIMNKNIQIESVGALKDAADAMAGLFDEGTEGQRRMQQAAAALGVVQAGLAAMEGVRAVLSAGQAAPPIGFASMAAMAAAVAPLLASIGAAIPAFGGGGGPAANSAEVRQATQGTGTVLGDMDAKSESIAKAMEITADATSALVGINRSMLTALQSMQASIGAASNMLARGAGAMDVNLSGGASMPSFFGDSFSVSSRAFANIFGGKESLRDQGVRIVGGTLSQMIDDIMVQSYQTIHRSGGWFRSSKDYDRTEALGDDVARQFQMVLASMADAVGAAADALGLNMDQISAAIAAFRIEEIRISTMGLSGEEAQKELEAVFSKIFDGLAGAVVPWIGEFQKVGEGLAETLIRVATGVQVTREAMIQLGFALDETDPQKFAQASEALMELAGGVEQFIEGMNTFMSAFATDEHKFAIAQDALNRAFEQFGLSVPASRDAMWDLMQSLDATTDAGREQIAMLLRLAGTADSYYNLLEEREQERLRTLEAYADYIAQFRPDTSPATGVDAATLAEAEEQARVWAQHMIYQANALAVAAGMQGAAVEDLALIHARAAEFVASAVERMAEAEIQYQDLVRGLLDERDAASLSVFATSLRDIGRWTRETTATLNAAAIAAGRQGVAEEDLAVMHQIAAARAAEAIKVLTDSMTESAVALGYIDAPDTLDYLNSRIAELQNASASAADGIGQAVDAMRQEMDLLLGDLSPFSDRQKLEMARTGLQQGSVTQEQFLTIAQRLFGRTSQYAREFDFAMRYPGQSASASDPSYSSVGSSSLDSRTLEELVAARDALMAAQRGDMAQGLARQLAELSAWQDREYQDIAATMGWGLEQLAADLGMSVGDLGSYLDTLADQFRAQAVTQDFAAVGGNIIAAIQQIGADIVDAIISGPDLIWKDPPEMVDPVGPVIRAPDVAVESEVVALRQEFAALNEKLTLLVEHAGRSADADEATAGATAEIAANTGDTVNELIRGQRTLPGDRRSAVGVR